MLFGPNYDNFTEPVVPHTGEITMFDTLVARNQPGVRSYLIAKGFGNANNPATMVEGLKALMQTNPDVVYYELMRLHPDRDMILDALGEQEEEEKPKKSSFSGEPSPMPPAWWPIQPGTDLSLDKLGINSSMLNTAIILVVIFLLIKIIKG